MTVEFLRQLPLFAQLPEADLQALWRGAETVSLSAGDWLMREGEIGDALFVVLEGGIEITKQAGQGQVTLAQRRAGEVIGEMALLEQVPRSASGRALEASRVLRIGKQAFAQVLSASPTAALALLHTFNARLQSTEALLRQNEKMAALGTLAAGLAHELNNPAAAVQRSAAQLHEVLDQRERLTGELGRLIGEPAQADRLAELRAELSQRTRTPPGLDPMARADREAELQAWLETKNVEEAWAIAPALVTLGYTPESLEGIRTGLPPLAFPAVMAWLAAAGEAQSLLSELKAGSDRIAEIVKAVKAYAYLDQAPVQEVDIHEGLENTIAILRHKLKTGIKVRREFAPDLPLIEAWGSELNQVWTNLIDNAIDAMQGEGELTLHTSSQDNAVVVEVGDTGEGIAPDVQPRIFDPFFTTKPPGQGTGLGLHIVHSIIARHRGQITVNSRPGATCFRVTLPLRLQQG